MSKSKDAATGHATTPNYTEMFSPTPRGEYRRPGVYADPAAQEQSVKESADLARHPDFSSLFGTPQSKVSDSQK